MECQLWISSSQHSTPLYSVQSKGFKHCDKANLSDLPNGDVEVITVYKTKPTLGIAIEGGANTKQPLPRVISITEGGSASDSGSMKVGQIILEVNGKSFRGLEHQQCAKIIAEAFKDKKTGHIEMTVLDPNALKRF